jgi:hypothetical protein
MRGRVMKLSYSGRFLFQRSGVVNPRPGRSLKGNPKSLGDPIKQQAFLRGEGKKDVKPSSVPLGDGLVIVYLFPLSTEISRYDRRIEFEARIGRVGILQFFNLDQMDFQGRLELLCTILPAVSNPWRGRPSGLVCPV